MSDWGAGYITEIEYLPGFYREQVPAHMALACLVNGVAPPDLSAGFTYCDLGCGAGETVSLLAAANPDSQFHGVDFHPAHIARAREAAARTGLDNLHFHEAGFAELADGDGPALPLFDIVALHGVYSWISRENRNAVVRLLARRVKPGGMVYVSYNSLPGWTPIMPLQRLLYEHAALTPDRPERRVAAALEFAQQLRGVGAAILGDQEALSQLKSVGPTDSEAEKLAYLSHEYLNAHWSPLYHVDVARDMAAAKLAYAGSATLLENFPDLALTPQQRELLDTVKDPALRETFKDYCANRPFRRDVFVRGARRLTAAERDQRLKALSLTLTISREECRTEFKAPLGEATMDKRRYGAMFDALAADGPHRLADLLNLPQVQAGEGAPPSPAEVAGLLAGSQQALIAQPPTAATPGKTAAARRFNRAQAAAALESMQRKTTALAAAGCGAGLHVSLVEILLYDALAAGVAETVEAVVEHALTRLAGGGPAAADHPNRGPLTESLGWCLANSLPVWRRLGMI